MAGDDINDKGPRPGPADEGAEPTAPIYSGNESTRYIPRATDDATQQIVPPGSTDHTQQLPPHIYADQPYPQAPPNGYPSAPLPEYPPQSSSYPPPSQPPPLKKSHGWAIAIVAVLLVAAIGGLVWYLFFATKAAPPPLPIRSASVQPTPSRAPTPSKTPPPSPVASPTVKPSPSVAPSRPASAGDITLPPTLNGYTLTDLSSDAAALYAKGDKVISAAVVPVAAKDLDLMLGNAKEYDGYACGTILVLGVPGCYVEHGDKSVQVMAMQEKATTDEVTAFAKAMKKALG